MTRRPYMTENDWDNLTAKQQSKMLTVIGNLDFASPGMHYHNATRFNRWLKKEGYSFCWSEKQFGETACGLWQQNLVMFAKAFGPLIKAISSAVRERQNDPSK